MKSLIFIIPAILALACGTNGSEEQNSAVEIIEEETASEEVLVNTAANTDSYPDMMYVIRNGSVGLFEIGIVKDKVEELALVYDNVEIEEIDLMAEGMPTPTLELTFDGSETITLQLGEADFTVCRIEVNTSLFTTAEGIGIGSTYGDLESNYVFDGIAWGDGGDPLVIVEEAGLSFIIEPGDWWQMGDVEGEIPGDTEVTAIILW
ncbi:MAG: hypothetical protein KAR40_11515 [Candidatus Sabulitectum sp.]|nr:hypothetical protein [Candidatus Sabulitectum sp.]